ncbi:hypothetical protein ACJA3J_09020 [Halobacillus sp. SY10]|uniref:Uncharacterized protein n=1 Tax=Halobacillus aidingensis TaxID=240303 RepID=A0A1H0V6H2_HALAD|nr:MULTISPECIES: hypothetical protein [Halobacillus]SDP74149.1 hypothetical protein SAMN05421677_13128 [Halobacillus aidingensis]
MECVNVATASIGFGGYQIVGDKKIPYSELEVIDYYFEKQSLFKKPM